MCVLYALHLSRTSTDKFPISTGVSFTGALSELAQNNEHNTRTTDPAPTMRMALMVFWDSWVFSSPIRSISLFKFLALLFTEYALCTRRQICPCWEVRVKTGVIAFLNMGPNIVDFAVCGANKEN